MISPNKDYEALREKYKCTHCGWKTMNGNVVMCQDPYLHQTYEEKPFCSESCVAKHYGRNWKNVMELG